jgi:hypothetical protein
MYARPFERCGHLLLAVLALDRIRLVQRRPVMTAAIAAGVATAAVAQRWPAAARLVEQCCGERPAQPWLVALAHLPGSLIAPAPGLPAWAAVGQVVLVVGVAECILGWRGVAVVGLLSHGIATLAGHLMVTWGPESLLGLSPAAGFEHDTGPSAFVIGVGAFAALRIRSWPLLGLTLAVTMTETALRPDLAGREHLAALAVGLAAASAQRSATGAPARTPRRSLRFRTAVVAASTLALSALGATGSALADPDTSVSSVALVEPGSAALAVRPGRSCLLVSGRQLHDPAWVAVLHPRVRDCLAVSGPLDAADLATMRGMGATGIDVVRVLPVTRMSYPPPAFDLDGAASATMLVVEGPPPEGLRWWARWRGIHLLVMTTTGVVRTDPSSAGPQPRRLLDARRLRPAQLALLP